MDQGLWAARWVPEFEPRLSASVKMFLPAQPPLQQPLKDLFLAFMWVLEPISVSVYVLLSASAHAGQKSTPNLLEPEL